MNQELFSMRLKNKLTETGLKRGDVVNHFQRLNVDYTVTRAAVDNWLRGNGKGASMPTLEKTIELAKLLNTSIDFLCGISDIDAPDINIAVVQNELGLTPDAQNFLYTETKKGSGGASGLFIKSLNTLLGKEWHRHIIGLIGDILFTPTDNVTIAAPPDYDVFYINTDPVKRKGRILADGEVIELRLEKLNSNILKLRNELKEDGNGTT